MQVLYFDEIHEKLNNIVLTIGQFDGLHLAHMKLIDECLAQAKSQKMSSAIMTFEPLIINVIKENATFPIISTDEKIKKCEQLGFDYFIIIKTNKDFLRLSKDTFIKSLKETMDVKSLIVGFDFSFGYLGEGKAKDLLSFFKTVIIPEISLDNKKIGTKLIKNYLSDGKIKDANKYLGYNFYLVKNGCLNEAVHLLKKKEYKVKINNQLLSFNPFESNDLPDKTIIEFIE